MADRYGAPWHGGDYAALLAAPGVEAVVICTPNALHVPQARAALEAGKHVFVQKPLALRPAEAREMVARAERRDRLLFVDYTYRYLATVAALRSSLADLGPPQRLRATFHNVYGPGKAWFFDPALSGGGALIDLGVHLLDLALDLLAPASPQLTSAALGYEQGHPVEDAAELLLDLDGVPFSLAVSWNAPRPLTEITFELEARAGLARWENVGGSFFRFRTLRDGACLLDRETTLRADSLRAFRMALSRGVAPPVRLEVYDLLADAYGRLIASWPPGTGSGRPPRQGPTRR